jgi:hypothetical protein
MAMPLSVHYHDGVAGALNILILQRNLALLHRPFAVAFFLRNMSENATMEQALQTRDEARVEGGRNEAAGERGKELGEYWWSFAARNYQAGPADEIRLLNRRWCA